MGSEQVDTAEFQFGLINQEGQKLSSVKGVHGSDFSFGDVQKINNDSFLDYLKGGCEIGLQIAIDFTGSNRPPHDHSSLHNMNMDKNQYYQAIKSVGEVL